MGRISGLVYIGLGLERDAVEDAEWTMAAVGLYINLALDLRERERVA